jgi:hypothetical protein
MLSVKFAVKTLMGFFLVLVIVFSWIVSFRFINAESTITLLIFSFLFGAIIFHLNGAVNKKLGLLAVGDILGLLWGFVFFYFASAGHLVFGGFFDAFYVLVFPFLNMLWIVTFWSLSMSCFSRSEIAAERF